MKKWIIGLVAVLAVAAAGLVWYFSQPKEMVRLSGYAMTAEDGEYLKEESFSLLAQSGKKIGTIKTDDEGYFYVRLRANETYQIQRDGFSVQVTAKGVNEYRIDQDKGYLLLGKRLEDEVSKVIYKPSVFYLKEQTDYTYARNQGTVRLEGRQDLQEGDIISLPPTKEYITGYILRVSSVAYEEDATLVTVTDDVSAKEVLQDATLDGKFDLSDGYILTNDNISISEETVEEVAFLPGSQTSSSLTYSGSSPTPTLLAKDKIEDGVEAKWKKIKNGRAVELSYEVTDEETDGNLAVDIGLEGTIEADFDYLGGKASVKSALTFSHEASSNVKDLWDKEAEIWLATIYIPTSTGLSLPIDIYFIFETNGNVSISAKESEKLTLAMTYDNGEVEFEHDYSGERNLDLKLEGELATGLKESNDISVAQIEILEVYAKAPLLELEGEFGFELTQENFEPVVMSDISGEFSARIGLDVGIETDLWEIEAEVAERELLSYEWEYPEEDTTASKTTKAPATKSTTEKALWDANKAQQLNDYILQTWGPALGQEYKSYTPSSTGNFYGVTVPNQLLEVTAETATGLAPDFNGSVPYWVWSENGLVAANEVAVVAVYSDIEKAAYPSAHLYFFTIVNGNPQVLITEQNQGNPEKRLYFRPTKNQELQAFFENLVLGGSSTVATETSSVTATNTSVDTKNLTIEQAANWAKAHAATRYGVPFTKDDFLSHVVTNVQSSDGLVYIEVREDHSSPNMKGTDPNVAPAAGFYRINANGQLEKMDVVAGTYAVVAETYFE